MSLDENELVAKLSLERKVRLLTGADSWGLHDEPSIGLRRIVLTDGPTGVRGRAWDERDPSLNLPSATALAATWDSGMAYRYGAALAEQARSKGADVVLGPTINLHRSPLGGRHFEAYSEDPLLTSRLASAYVRGLQDSGVGACPKHYVANEFEADRRTTNVVVSERALRELYLAAFEDVVVNERPWMVMAAYNWVNGPAMTENPLLAEPLAGEWGFDGVVVSDWGAVYDGERSAAAMLDLEMPGPDGLWGARLVDAVRGGRVPESAVDEKVLRLLRLASRVGALSPEGQSRPEEGDSGAGLARQLAAESTVLLRNEGELPWARTPGSIAVIGHQAVVPCTQGGGSASVVPEYVVSPLDGLRAALPDAEITWSLGTLTRESIAAFPLSRLTDPDSGEPGIRMRSLDASGAELLSENRRSAYLSHMDRSLPDGTEVVELRTRYRPDESGTLRLGVATLGRVWLSANGNHLLTAELPRPGELAPPGSASIPVDAGAEMEILVRLELPPRPPHSAPIPFCLGTDLAADGDAISAAVQAARAAEVAVVVVGTNAYSEREGVDRSTLALPGRQDELVRAVAAAHPRTVVVVNAGSPVLMPWHDEVAAVLLTWFGGQETGNALADVLLGHVEPGGRLPTTWPATEADVPVLDTAPVGGVVAYEEDIHVGYRAWLRSGTAPAYDFGFGLGYTSWEVRDPSAAGLDVTVTVANVGERPGKHVVQAYLSRGESAVDRPVRWLAGYAVVRLEPGAEQMVRIPIGRRALAHWDGGWQVEPGRYTVHIGSSATDLPLTVDVDVDVT
ncbi:MAG TPA: glycoside hydrolase family 3 C-terminal domain-containing protein [Candidatus Limnocylindrales bacterium]